jgi:hypothetical protein
MMSDAGRGSTGFRSSLLASGSFNDPSLLMLLTFAVLYSRSWSQNTPGASVSLVEE